MPASPATVAMAAASSVEDIVPFGVVILLVAVAVLVAALSNRLSELIRVPAPAFFLVAAAVASDVFPSLGGLSIRTDERIVTVALIFILFDGGMRIGWRRFRRAAAPVVWVGLAGTFVTAGAMALAAHALFGFDWRPAMLIGAALAPTDPAVVFSVLGRREISGRAGTILEGESGVNDPVGIALMVALLGATGGGAHVVLGGVAEFLLQMLVGGVIGVAGGYALIVLMRRLPLPNEALYPIRTLAFGALVYGAAVLLHGSGFLAVFLAGIVIGDLGAPYKREIERFASGVASLAEIVAFIVLGLTISVRDILGSDQIWVGLALAVILIVLVRPILVGLLLLPVKLARGERLFVLWSGLKGAVPILLGAFILNSDLPEAKRIYGIVFLAVLVSVVVQGGLIPTFAKLLRVPIRNVELEPWSLGLRFQDEPQGLHRHFVAAGSPADGTSVADLDIGESAWISMISRNGRLVQVRGNTVLRAGDEVLALADPDIALARLFRPSRDGAS